MSALEISGLRKSWNNFEVLQNISLSVRQGEFLSLLGPSGCGKTTILRIIAGLMEPTSGTIHLDGRDITWEAVHKRQIGLVFQSYALFPHMTVAENVSFGLKRRKMSHAEIQKKVGRSLESVQLGHLASRFPRELSGGQQQRVALARATVIEPQLLLLDEPLSNLDAMLRTEMGIEIKRLQRELGTTTVFVTHDQVEALSMSDRICLLNRGKITQLSTPEELYQQPASTFVATFIGRANILKAVVIGQENDETIATLVGSDVKIRARGNASVGQVVSAAVRQHVVNIDIDRPNESLPPNHARATMVFAAFGGSVLHYVLQLDGNIEIYAETAATMSKPFAVGDRVIVSWPSSAATIVHEDVVP